MPTPLLTDLINRVQQTADRVDSSYRPRALSALDEAIQWAADAAPWEGLKDREQFLTDGTSFLTLPDRVHRILSIADVANTRRVVFGDDWLRRQPGALLDGTAGAALEVRHLGTVPVIEQPDNDTLGLTLATTVSDTIDVTVRGLVHESNASGTSLEYREQMEVFSITGTTTVTTSNQYKKIIGITKAKDSVSDLKVTLTGSGKEISRIPPWDSQPQYQRLELVFKPGVGTVLQVEYFRRPDRLVSESDVIDPWVNQEAVMWRAAGNMHWHDNEGQSAQLAWQKADEILTRRRQADESFGESSRTINPFSYLDLEDSR